MPIVTFNLSDYTVIKGNITNASNAYTGIDSDTYAHMAGELDLDIHKTVDVSFFFSPSGIPSEATINSVTVNAKCYFSASGQYINEPRLSVYFMSLGEPMGRIPVDQMKTVQILSKTYTDLTADLLQEKLRLHLSGLTTPYNSQTYADFVARLYGAELIIDYTEPTKIKGEVVISGTTKELSGGAGNVNGSWKEISDAYINIGGTWKEMAQ